MAVGWAKEEEKIGRNDEMERIERTDHLYCEYHIYIDPTGACDVVVSATY